MKLNKRFWLIIGIGIFVIALGSLSMVLFQQIDEQDALKEQLTLAQSNINKIQLATLSSRQTELEMQLSQATSQRDAVKSILSQPVGSVAAATTLFDIAEAHGLEVIEMTSSAPATEDLEGVTCSVVSLTAKIEGDVSSLVGFVTELNSYLTTGIVKSTKIIMTETNNEESTSVDIHLVVYTYQSD